MLLKLLKKLFRPWLRLFAGRGRSASVFAVRATIASPPAPAPAVAGFVQRVAPPADFHLAARLASVAHLNTRTGRIPASSGKRTANTKAVPKLQPATRKRTTVPATVIRSRAAVQTARSAQVLPMPKASRSRCIPLDIRIQQAA